MYSNYNGTNQLNNLLVSKKEIRKIRNKETEYLVHRYNDFLNEKLYSAMSWDKVEIKGPRVDFFITKLSKEEKDNESKNNKVELNVLVTGDLREDIKNFIGTGLEVDNNMELAPENNQCANKK